MDERLVRLVSLATLGTYATVQDLTRKVLSAMEGADPELVAEETMAFVSMASARALEAGMQALPEARGSISQVIEELPFIYRDYLMAGLIIRTENPEVVASGEEIHRRLKRKMEFYRLQFPTGQFPTDRLLKERMEIWMGRISPPNLPDSPGQRLQKLGLLPLLRTHLRILVAQARHALIS